MMQGLSYRQRKYFYDRMEYDSQKKIDRLMSKNYKDTKSWDKVVYWSMLVLAIVGNLVVTIVLIPLIAVLSQWGLLLVLAVIAITFGALFAGLLRDIESLNTNSYVIGEIFLPIQALINVYFITMLANEVSSSFQLTNWNNPLVIGIVYTCGFVSPYIFVKAMKLGYKVAG